MQPLRLALIRSSLVQGPSFFLSSSESLDLQFHAKDLMNIWSHQFEMVGPHLDLY